MAITKVAVTILASTSVAAATTKASPGATGAIPCTSYYGGEITYKITNGSSAPTVPCTVTFQTSQDNTNWYDYQSVAGDTTASSVNSGSLLLDRGVMYLRGIAYGNATNSVTVESYLQAVTAV